MFEWTNLHVAGAFLVGAILATMATLRIVRHVTEFFAGVERRRRRPPGPPTDDT